MILLDHRDLYRRKSGGDEVDDSDESGLRGGAGGRREKHFRFTFDSVARLYEKDSLAI